MRPCCATTTGQAPGTLSVHLDEAAAGVVLGTGPSTAALQARVAADAFPGATDGIGTLAGSVAGTAGSAVAALAAAVPVPAGEPALRQLARHVAPSCSGTGTDGNRVQVIYAVEAGRTDRYARLLTSIRSWVADVDDTFAASSARTGGGLRVRWVHHGCVTDIDHQVLPAGSLGNGFAATVAALRARGYTDPTRKYLVFADDASLCGIGQLYQDTAKAGNANDGEYPMFARADSPCWTVERGWHSTAAHELMHMLGGIQDDAPNSTKAGHCNDETDVMCYADHGSDATMRAVCSGVEELFDCRGDDYFNTAPAAGSYLDRHWNTATSSFLDSVTRLAPAPAVSAAGPASVRAGLSATYTATDLGRNASYRWTATPADCVPASRAARTVQLTCPSWRTGTVRLTLAAATPGSLTRTVTRTVTLARSPKAALDVAVGTAARATVAGAPATVRVQLSHRGSAVRGTVTLFAKTASGSWKRISPFRDTGADGVHTWTVRPRKTTRYVVTVVHTDRGSRRAPAEAGTTVRVK